MIKAPIALFVFKRPQHTEKALEALSRCEGADESELFIFCDGPKRAEDMKAVEEVRNLVKSRKWCGKVNIIERDKNWGLANSIISGVTEVCEKFGRVIVLEDDLIVSRYFLEYMNTALDLYENSEQVMQISGHVFPVKFKAETDSLFFQMATTWGWATWQRAWVHFDRGMKGHEVLKRDNLLRNKFDLDGAYPYFKMIQDQLDGKVDSWGIRWYLSIFMQSGLTLFPVKTLIEQIGFDGSGTHTKDTDNSFYGTIEDDNFRVLTFPPRLEIAEPQFEEYKRYLKRGWKGLLAEVKDVMVGFITKYV